MSSRRLSMLLGGSLNINSNSTCENWCLMLNFRDKLYSSYESFVQEAEKSNLSKTCDEIEDWLYGDGEDLPKSKKLPKRREFNIVFRRLCRAKNKFGRGNCPNQAPFDRVWRKKVSLREFDQCSQRLPKGMLFLFHEKMANIYCNTHFRLSVSARPSCQTQNTLILRLMTWGKCQKLFKRVGNSLQRHKLSSRIFKNMR